MRGKQIQIVHPFLSQIVFLYAVDAACGVQGDDDQRDDAEGLEHALEHVRHGNAPKAAEHRISDDDNKNDDQRQTAPDPEGDGDQIRQRAELHGDHRDVPDQKRGRRRDPDDALPLRIISRKESGDAPASLLPDPVNEKKGEKQLHDAGHGHDPVLARAEIMTAPHKSNDRSAADPRSQIREKDEPDTERPAAVAVVLK